MLVELEATKNEEQEKYWNTVQYWLNDPGPKCHVDVDNVSLFPIPYDIL